MQALELMNTLLIAATISFVICVLIVYSQGWHGKHSMDHDLTGVQKFHTTAVPRVGGIALIAGLYFSIAVCSRLEFGIFTPENALPALKLLVAGLPIFIAGITEDLTKRISVKVRLSAAFLSALLASFLIGATLDELNIWGIDQLLTFAPIALIVTSIVVAGGINAINIIDGFNGLAGTVVVIMLTALGFLARQHGDSLVTLLALVGVGATLGFLLVNYPKGRLFLGDGGAYLLGFWVSEVCVLLLIRNPEVSAWQVLAICAYPVIEVLYSIYRRKIVRQASPGAPDGLHMHTLIYRRVVPKVLPYCARRPWVRNAAVTFLVGPCIALVALIAVLAGDTIVGAAMIVAAQVWLYITAYKRLVRGRWRRAQETAPEIGEDSSASVS